MKNELFFISKEKKSGTKAYNAIIQLLGGRGGFDVICRDE
jgi:hypothetical protein